MSGYNISANLQTGYDLNVNLVKAAISLSRNDYVKPFRGQFTVDDLDEDNILTVTHNLNIVAKTVQASIFDENGELVVTRLVTVDANTIQLDIGNFVSLLGSNTWKYLIIG